MPIAQARELFDACYRPPAAMGDVYDVIERERPDVIGIIDGYFDSVPSVWHKEILFALSRGIRVVGASSMGALRAAELCTFGMEGVGWVFEAFRSGTLEDDDEVAVLHGPPDTGYVAISTAMVNLRVGLQRACERGIIGEGTHTTLVKLAKRCFYQERSWDHVMLEATAHGLPASELELLQAFVDAERPDIKREDACVLLGQLASAPIKQKDNTYPEPVATIFWDKLRRTERRSGPTESALRAEELRRFTKATDVNLPKLLRDALLICLAEKDCESRAVELTQERFETAIRDFRLRHNLASADTMRAWLARAGLNSDRFRDLMIIEGQIATLLEIHANSIDARLLDALALSGRLAEALARKATGEENAQANAVGPQSRPSAAEVEAFYRSHIRGITGSLQRHAQSIGFSSAADLIDEVRKIYQPSKD
jgi:hypothetical protein